MALQSRSPKVLASLLDQEAVDERTVVMIEPKAFLCDDYITGAGRPSTSSGADQEPHSHGASSTLSSPGALSGDESDDGNLSKRLARKKSYMRSLPPPPPPSPFEAMSLVPFSNDSARISSAIPPVKEACTQIPKSTVASRTEASPAHLHSGSSTKVATQSKEQRHQQSDKAAKRSEERGSHQVSFPWLSSLLCCGATSTKSRALHT
ncbi:hypothetical protein CEUSTIGMA_g4606.t1 [Chlamydomonas eustigma]|uniref:Uncharacterized protein n=1 Tax=Chlamydomonas eustigma TaxID=1157962 RepID=A0A250X265_9CHLO|nr:hypothetical protein CEUSTIGMA_g4606.t1 [Chlamydomonas eustigma]|eukprot:GAX77161.1 hypothetical protein CEUSTIGMA_g4606.t1 [Chlamydomonas eustigma]